MNNELSENPDGQLDGVRKKFPDKVSAHKHMLQKGFRLVGRRDGGHYYVHWDNAKPGIVVKSDGDSDSDAHTCKYARPSVHEETQLDEISAGKMKAYYDKSIDQVSLEAGKKGVRDAQAGRDTGKTQTHVKRNAGLESVVRRLAPVGDFTKPHYSFKNKHRDAQNHAIDAGKKKSAGDKHGTHWSWEQSKSAQKSGKDWATQLTKDYKEDMQIDELTGKGKIYDIEKKHSDDWNNGDMGAKAQKSLAKSIRAGHIKNALHARAQFRAAKINSAHSRELIKNMPEETQLAEVHNESQLKTAIERHRDGYVNHVSKAITHSKQAIKHLESGNRQAEDEHDRQSDYHNRVAGKHDTAMNRAQGLLDRIRNNKSRQRYESVVDKRNRGLKMAKEETQLSEAADQWHTIIQDNGSERLHMHVKGNRRQAVNYGHEMEMHPFMVKPGKHGVHGKTVPSKHEIKLKEETQLDEVSSKTLYSYANQAANSIKYHNDDRRQSFLNKDVENHTRKTVNRASGLAKALTQAPVKREAELHAREMAHKATRKTERDNYFAKHGKENGYHDSSDFIKRVKNDEHAQKHIDAARQEHGSIRVRGRLGKDNPHAHLYKRGGPLHRPSAQDYKREHSTHLDLYKRTRYEEYDQLDEISKATALSYIQGASMDKSYKAIDHDRMNHDGTRSTQAGRDAQRALGHKHGNRSSGIQLAAAKLAGDHNRGMYGKISPAQADKEKIALHHLDRGDGTGIKKRPYWAKVAASESYIDAARQEHVSEANSVESLKSKMKKHGNDEMWHNDQADKAYYAAERGERSAKDPELKAHYEKSSDRHARRAEQHGRAWDIAHRLLKKHGVIESTITEKIKTQQDYEADEVKAGKTLAQLRIQKDKSDKLFKRVK